MTWSNTPGEVFKSLEIVVGRGSHSTHGVAKLRPVVARYIAGRGYRSDSESGEKGEGAMIIGLTGQIS